MKRTSRGHGGAHAHLGAWVLVLLAAFVAVAAGAGRRPGSAHAQAAPSPHEAQMRAIGRELACPVCQGLSVADSPAPLATQMREVILQKLDQGESRDQIVQYFVDRYGEGILFSPPKRGFGLLIWWVPVLVLAGGGVAVGLALRRWVHPPNGHRLPRPTDAELAAYLPVIDAELARRGEGT